jgi:hypothetical protein
MKSEESGHAITWQDWSFRFCDPEPEDDEAVVLNKENEKQQKLNKFDGYTWQPKGLVASFKEQKLKNLTTESPVAVPLFDNNKCCYFKCCCYSSISLKLTRTGGDK